MGTKKFKSELSATKIYRKNAPDYKLQTAQNYLYYFLIDFPKTQIKKFAFF